MQEKTQHFSLHCLGVNHWKAPLEVRECFYMSQSVQTELIEQLLAKGVQSVFVISTCNRTEIFWDGSYVSEVMSYFSNAAAGNDQLFEEYGFYFQADDAIQHIFELATGIDSMILGDMQIIYQIKESAQFSNSIGGIKGPMYRLLDTVIKTYKRVRNETEIASGAASIAHAGVLFVKQHFDQPENKRILLVGTGKIGEVTCKNLFDQGFTDVTLVNRSYEKAERLSEKFEYETKPFDSLEDAITHSDIILVATGAPKAIILEHMVPKDGSRRLFLDLSIPRNVDIELEGHQDVELVNLDALNKIQDSTLQKREGEIPKVRAIINEEISEFNEWLEHAKLGKLFKQIEEAFHSERKFITEQFKSQFSNNELEKAEKLSESIVNRLVRQTIVNLKDNYNEQGDLGNLANLLFSFKSLQNIEQSDN